MPLEQSSIHCGESSKSRLLTVNSLKLAGNDWRHSRTHCILKQTRTYGPKVEVTGCSGIGVTTATLTISVGMITDVVLGTVDELDVEASGNANTDNIFRHNSAGGHYIYNLSTKNYGGGTYRVTATAENGETQQVDFSLK